MVSRRDFLKFGAAAAAAPLATGASAEAAQTKELKKGGQDFSFLSGTEREGIPSACSLCASRCPIIGYVERGILVKIEGQPDSIRTHGVLCPRGQAGLNQVYDPDRILHPMKRAGRRGEGKWNRISWDAALDELAGRLKRLRDGGTPEKFMFHHGWISTSADRLINKVFLPAYGTATIADNSCLGQSARLMAHKLTWGGGEDNWDFDNTRFVLNFGSNVLEAHTNHVALASRLARRLGERGGLRMVTFDVRLSNTAARSDRWIKIKPGTDLAVVLAMCNVIMERDLYKAHGEEFLRFCKVTPGVDASIADKVAALKGHLKDFTPAWAAGISDVPAAEIEAIAVAFATNWPACVISSRGASAGYNGVEVERAIQMLAAITGNIDNPGGRTVGVVPVWNHPEGPKDKPAPKKLAILEGFAGAAALPVHGVGQQVLRMIKDGKAGRPDVYMWYTYNPVYSNGNIRESLEILKDESLIPYTVAVTPFYDESAACADLILPDATYLERFDFEDGVSPSQVPEYYIRQPVIPPQGESRDFKDVCIELAKRLGIPLGVASAQKFVEATCEMTPAVKGKARGFRGIAKSGVWHDRDAKPVFGAYRTPVDKAELEKDGVIFDRATGVYWNWKTAGVADADTAQRFGYSAAPGAHTGYVAQRFGDIVALGFKPASVNKSGYFEIHSSILAEKGLSALPRYTPVPEHASLKPNELILTTYRVSVHTLGSTQNSRWLTEINHESPAWINPATAEGLGIRDGDRIKIATALGELQTSVMVTHNAVPGIVAISSHGGHWEYGRYASGKRSPEGVDDPLHDKLKWWPEWRAHPNMIIPVTAEPISGQQRWMDTVVTVTKASAA